MIDKKVKGPKMTLKKEGTIDLDSLYSNIKSWFDEYDYSFNEDTHQQKTTQKGKSIKYTWTGKREATEYIQFIIEVKFYITEYSEKERKLELEIESRMELDHKDKWQDTEVKSKVFKIFNTLFKNDEIGSFKKKLSEEVANLIKLAKQELNLET
ncbi:MAG: hypothetical protein ABIJ20_03370 [Nanoarchaeota archaeon]|nr:hypothetical protein [Nanoarchaeota archaeon]MBU1445451.1 hypothetical protein [Nanoarchaeota archaeon]MBU2406981.1 hypothetical protein [Nanoarchaeota archaeon]MBU2420259.1 hypothetical protein [Nanoarchaeota archaeon]MBU2474978.1 hypothetical protein [Nanoarchaeota archaeon]